MDPIISIKALSKVYDNGFAALNKIDLDIHRGEILALLGPNGAGKTTLISTITGIVSASSGQVLVDGHDNVKEYRAARQLIGLVPQELTLGAFETVFNTVSFTRGLFGLKPDPEYINGILKELSLYDKRDNQLRMLSGGMKRRVLIAKALSHAPRILFLDEPTAGVDVELRKDMWKIVNRLRDSGVTIILTTHYIEEAEEVADRVAVIRRGEILLVEEKTQLMQKLGKKQLVVEFKQAQDGLPDSLNDYDVSLSDNGNVLTYTYDATADATGITKLMLLLNEAGMSLKDVRTTQSSLEDIFVNLVHQDEPIAETAA
ncbi:ABC transporter ATP-binding protein [Arenicella xantha]|uniref:ABC-2 type transport system ATP-binding protein n=1 Tax=Arenicella xantha TaxID=644221 RepID=A0A395JK26_9GAMM|nr:ABC transporter ATP-binding protein [Arenicella xantha]RBP49148.1 ABC-2 type transport system ATP-binding protein [Arenicella xantha]